jgi:hypothetical protein
MINGRWTVNNFEEICLGLIEISQNFPAVIEKNHENRQDSRCRSWDSNQTLSEYKYAALPLDQPGWSWSRVTYYLFVIYLMMLSVSQAILCHMIIW